jgi:hypothetical protein
MEPATPGARELLSHSVEHAAAIDSLVGRMTADSRHDEGMPTLVAVSRGELDELRTLVASGDTSPAACTRAIEHLVRLDHVLTLASAMRAESAYTLADRFAVAEEFTLDRAASPLTAARAVALGDKLAGLSFAEAPASRRSA